MPGTIMLLRPYRSEIVPTNGRTKSVAREASVRSRPTSLDERARSFFALIGITVKRAPPREKKTPAKMSRMSR